MCRLQVELGFNSLFFRHSCPDFHRDKLQQESRREFEKRTRWIPAFAGMTKLAKWSRSFTYLAHVHFVYISPIFALPEGEGFPPSPMLKLKSAGAISRSLR
jgi:hypothetical protein